MVNLHTRRTFLSAWGLAAVSVAAPWVVPAAAQTAEEQARSRLAQGGAVVYFRHGATTWSGVDNIEWPRERQRLLSDLPRGRRWSSRRRRRDSTTCFN